MADVPAELQCRLDTTYLGESEDLTHLEIDPETEARIAQLIAEGTGNDWALAPSRIRGE